MTRLYGVEQVLNKMLWLNFNMCHLSYEMITRCTVEYDLIHKPKSLQTYDRRPSPLWFPGWWESVRREVNLNFMNWWRGASSGTGANHLCSALWLENRLLWLRSMNAEENRPFSKMEGFITFVPFHVHQSSGAIYTMFFRGIYIPTRCSTSASCLQH